MLELLCDRHGGPAQRLPLSGDGAFFLPGRIVVGGDRGETRPAGKRPSHAIQKRFWVRGHWRRANPSWHDQRLRWIAPHLKGPKMTAVIEREYELRGSVRVPAPRGEDGAEG